MRLTRLVIDALAARFGGTAYAAIQTAKQLAQVEDFREVLVVAREGSIVANGLKSDGKLRLQVLPEATKGELPRRVAWEALVLPREVARDGAALLMTWSGMLPRRLPTPVISLVSNPLVFECNGLANRLRRRAMRRTARGTTRLIAPTTAMADLVKQALGAEVSVVPWGVDHRRFSPATEPGNEVLCVADFYSHKRHDIVLDAWAMLPPPRRPLRLIGDPRVDSETYRRVVARVRRYRKFGTVHLDQHLTLTELVTAYQRARALVIASEHESFCLPLLEALACGVPAVARDLPALRETGGPGTSFVASDDGQAWAAELDTLLTDNDRHRRAQVQGLEHSARFEWERTAETLLDCVFSREHL
jgi:glycosyltransferase involved in cell wall biosynthesis